MGSKAWVQGTMAFLMECLQGASAGREDRWGDPGPGELDPGLAKDRNRGFL